MKSHISLLLAKATEWLACFKSAATHWAKRGWRVWTAARLAAIPQRKGSIGNGALQCGETEGLKWNKRDWRENKELYEFVNKLIILANKIHCDHHLLAPYQLLVEALCWKQALDGYVRGKKSGGW